ncbi:MAG: redoxin family protein [Vallitaleaceae bacterium]|nr:redoxin family protein [Vallitaleaceae bacterium]
MKKIKFVSLIITLVFVLTGCNAVAETNAEPVDASQMMNKGDVAATFKLMDVKGDSYDLADLAGEKVYIKFWASWCPICLAGLEEVNTLAGETNDFKVFTIVSPGYKNEKNSDAFIKWYTGVEGVENLTVLFDEDGTLTQKYGVRGYPTSAFIGSDGVLIKTQAGHINNEDIQTEMDNIF